jgi:hypothetical protein
MRAVLERYLTLVVVGVIVLLVAGVTWSRGGQTVMRDCLENRSGSVGEPPARLIKILKTLEMAGIKVEFREQFAQITERAEDAGLLSEPDQRLGTQETYESIYNSDPTLALAGLRIELERRLGELATVRGLKGGPPPRGVGQLIRILSDEGVLDRDEASVIADLLPLMNKAVHSEEYSQEAAGWAIRVGPNYWQRSTGKSPRRSRARRNNPIAENATKFTGPPKGVASRRRSCGLSSLTSSAAHSRASGIFPASLNARAFAKA